MMKKMFRMFLAIFTAITLCSNSMITVLANENVTIYYESIVQTSMSGIDFVLSEEEKDVVLEVLNSSEWTDGEAQEVGDYLFLTDNDERIYYDIWSGWVYEETNNRSVKLSEENAVAINVIVCSKIVPPVEPLGPILEKENTTLSDMIDAYIAKLDERGYDGVFIVDRLFGGDTERAKSVLDNELFRDLFPSADMRFERYFDLIEWRVSVSDEEYVINGEGVELNFRTYQSFASKDRYVKVNTDNGEYHKLKDNYLYGNEYAKMYIELGEDVVLHIYVYEGSEASTERLLDYGFAVKEAILKGDEMSTEPATEPITEPTTEPATESITEPATEPATEPITEPATEPATESITEPETEFYIGMSYSDFLSATEENDTLVCLGCYAYLLDESTDVIVKFDNECLNVECIEKYTHKAVSSEEFSKISNGMTIYEVVETIGLPYGSFTFGMLTLNFASSDGMALMVYFESGSNMVVTGTSVVDYEPTTEPTTEPATEPATEASTEASDSGDGADKGGCGATVGIGVVSVVTVAAAWCALTKKKKENNA